jgi:hypothetical protein
MARVHYYHTFGITFLCKFGQKVTYARVFAATTADRFVFTEFIGYWPFLRECALRSDQNQKEWDKYFHNRSILSQIG